MARLDKTQLKKFLCFFFFPSTHYMQDKIATDVTEYTAFLFHPPHPIQLQDMCHTQNHSHRETETLRRLY